VAQPQFSANYAMHALLESLLKESPVLTDGAWGTQLQARGLPPGTCPDRWNQDRPDAVELVARAYVEAGSRIILTNTFGANRFVLEGHGLADEVERINRAGAEISKRAAMERALVFGSIGPTGKMLVMDECTEDEMFEAFSAQAAGLVAGGADGIVIETMADPAEAAVAVKAAKESGVLVVASFVFDSGESLDRTMMGTTPEEAVAVAMEAGADVVGANCGQGIEGFISLCSRMKAATELPIWIKANAGLPELVDGTTVYRTTAKQFAEQVPALIGAGADFVGGCCGTTPEFIRETASRLGPA
jgi:methionine synthase I (cobalamin-dependent)